MRRTSSRLAVLAALLCVLLGVPSTALGEARAMAPSAAGDGSVSDPNISYVGRWDLSSDVAVPNWAGAYFETKFTGTTVSLKQRDAVNLYASIDGGPLVFYPAVEGTVNLTPEPLDAGTHTLQVTYRSGDTVFQGLALEEGARTVDPELSPKLVEFVGDSITAGATSSKEAASGYGYVLGEQLGVRHTQIARSGYCLVSTPDCVGQSAQFFKVGSEGDQNWDFTRYQANAVVINLGTNDVGSGISGEQFQETYTQFLRDIRAKYPDAALFAMETFKQRYVAETQAAVQTVQDEGDDNVHFINTEGWLTPDEDFTDGDGHPNDQGHRKVAQRLAEVLAPVLGVAKS